MGQYSWLYAVLYVAAFAGVTVLAGVSDDTTSLCPGIINVTTICALAVRHGFQFDVPCGRCRCRRSISKASCTPKKYDCTTDDAQCMQYADAIAWRLKTSKPRLRCLTDAEVCEKHPDASFYDGCNQCRCSGARAGCGRRGCDPVFATDREWKAICRKNRARITSYGKGKCLDDINGRKICDPSYRRGFKFEVPCGECECRRSRFSNMSCTLNEKCMPVPTDECSLYVEEIEQNLKASKERSHCLTNAEVCGKYPGASFDNGCNRCTCFGSSDGARCGRKMCTRVFTTNDQWRAICRERQAGIRSYGKGECLDYINDREICNPLERRGFRFEVPCGECACSRSRMSNMSCTLNKECMPVPLGDQCDQYIAKIVQKVEVSKLRRYCLTSKEVCSKYPSASFQDGCNNRCTCFGKHARCSRRGCKLVFATDEEWKAICRERQAGITNYGKCRDIMRIDQACQNRKYSGRRFWDPCGTCVCGKPPLRDERGYKYISKHVYCRLNTACREPTNSKISSAQCHEMIYLFIQTVVNDNEPCLDRRHVCKRFPNATYFDGCKECRCRPRCPPASCLPVFTTAEDWFTMCIRRGAKIIDTGVVRDKYGNSTSY